MLLEVARRHACVAIYFCVAAKTLLLTLTRTDDAFTNSGRCFFSALAGDVPIFHSRHFNVQIDAIQQRPGNALAITLHLGGTATAFAFQVAKVTAWTRIHGSDKHELRWKSNAARSAGNGDFPIFEWLAHHLQCRSFELRQFIQKKDAVVSEAHFARIWERAAAEQPNVANGVMRRPEWSRGDEGFFGIQQPGDAVNLCGFNRLLERKRRNDRRDTFGQHRFARAGGTDHQDVVTAGHCDFNGPFDVSLTFYVSEIDVIILVGGKKSGQNRVRWEQWSVARQKSQSMTTICNAVDIDIVDHCGLDGIRFGDKQRALAATPRLQCNRQNAFHWADRTVQRELADKAEVFKRRAVQPFCHRNHSKRDWQVKAGSFLFDVGRGNIALRTPAWPVVATVCNGGGNAIAAFPDSGVWQPNNNDVRIAPGAVDFDFYLVCVHAINGCGVNLGQHRHCRVAKNRCTEKRQISL